MKTFLYILLMLVISTGTAFTQISVHSNGTGGGDWALTTTWAESVVPTSVDEAIITGTDSVFLDATGSCATLRMGANTKLGLNGTVVLPGTVRVLDAASFVYYAGTQTMVDNATFGNLIWASTSADGGQFTASTTIDGNLTVNCNHGLTNNHALRGISASSGSFTHTIAGNVIIGPNAYAKLSGVNNPGGGTSASVTWNIGGNVTMTGNSSHSKFNMFESIGPHTGTVVFNIDGDLTVDDSCSMQLRSQNQTGTPSGVATINLKGNFVINGVISSGVGDAGRMIYNMNGTSPQTISRGSIGSLLSFPTNQSCNIMINNSAGVTLNSALDINGNDTLTLVNGVLNTTSTNVLRTNPVSSAGIAGGNASSFVNGPLLRSINSTSPTVKVFPIGKGTAYRPITLTVTQGATTYTNYTAETFNTAPVANFYPGTLNKVSLVRYHIITKGIGANVTASSVQLSYDADDGVTSSADLRIAQGPAAGGGTWSDVGGTGTANTTGTITSADTLTSFSNTVFTLANNSGGTNALPVEMTSFAATTTHSNVTLVWKTATEVNNLGFEIERRTGTTDRLRAANWLRVGFVQGAGTSNSPKEYSFTDNGIIPGVYIYRIKQIDNDGTFKYSASTQVDAGATKGFELLSNCPNPFNPVTEIRFSVPADGYASLKVYNTLGQEVATLFDGMAQAGHYIQTTFNGSRFASGVYFSRLQYNGECLVQRMLMTK
jgi:hypothetical protein